MANIHPRTRSECDASISLPALKQNELTLAFWSQHVALVISLHQYLKEKVYSCEK